MRENWYRDLWSLILTAIVALALWFGYSNNRDRINDVQAQRHSSIFADCQHTNAEHMAIVGFIDRAIPKARRQDPRVVAYLARARRAFPQRDCTRLTEQRVKAK